MPKRRATVGQITVPAEAWERVFGRKPKRACSCGGPETCAIPDDYQRVPSGYGSASRIPGEPHERFSG